MCFNSVFSDQPYLTLSGKPVDVVDNDLYLGNRIYNNIYTQCSNSMISDFYRHSNQVKDSFRMCDSFTLSNLHFTFISFYGIELYNLNRAPLKIYIQHGVNVCALYFVCLIPFIIILFLI